MRIACLFHRAALIAAVLGLSFPVAAREPSDSVITDPPAPAMNFLRAIESGRVGEAEALLAPGFRSSDYRSGRAQPGSSTIADFVDEVAACQRTRASAYVLPTGPRRHQSLVQWSCDGGRDAVATVFTDGDLVTGMWLGMPRPIALPEHMQR